LSLDESNLIVRAAKLAFDAAGQEMPPLHFACTNAIPFGAGLGSSSAAIVSGVLAAAAIAGLRLTKSQLLQVATALENHVDNLAPCVYGGLQVWRRYALCLAMRDVEWVPAR
jgi:homoserine kinase